MEKRLRQKRGDVVFKREDNRWLDHWFSVNGQLISEPYNLNQNDIHALINFCGDVGATFHITGKSSWYPGETLRITIMDKTKH